MISIHLTDGRTLILRRDQLVKCIVAGSALDIPAKSVCIGDVILERDPLGRGNFVGDPTYNGTSVLAAREAEIDSSFDTSDLLTRISHLEAEVARLRDGEGIPPSESNHKLRKQIAHLSNDRNRFRNERDELQSEIDGWNNRFERWQETIARLNAHIDELQTERSDAQHVATLMSARAERLMKSRDEMQAELDDYKATFDLRHDADMRAITRWRAGRPDRELKMPGQDDLCIFLLSQLEALTGVMGDEEVEGGKEDHSD